MARGARAGVLACGLLLGAAVGGCAGPSERLSPGPDPSPSTPVASAPSRGRAPSTEIPGASAPSPAGAPSTETRAGRVISSTDVVTGLDAPWGLAFLPDGRALITLRDEARVLVLKADGGTTDAVGPGARDLAATTTPVGEAGLLGVAVAPASSTHAGEIYLYRTVATGNEVVRTTLDGRTLSALRPVLSGIPKGDHHDGGGLAFGPDGFLYVTTGDAGAGANAQDRASLGGKILRITADGDAAPGNPTPGSPVWTTGHRNVQGVGWAPDGRMFASELGETRMDELNLIVAGGNYGWPEVEGTGGTALGFADPVVTWPTSDASPSGLAVTADGVYLAGLRGERMWRVPLTADGAGAPQPLLVGTFGRLRAVVRAPDRSLWLVTNNTDGRGVPRPGDDRVVRITVG